MDLNIDDFELGVIKSALYEQAAKISSQAAEKAALGEDCTMLHEAIETVLEVIAKLKKN